MGKTRIFKLSTHVRYLKRELKRLRNRERDIKHPVVAELAGNLALLVEKSINDYELYYDHHKYYIEINTNYNRPVRLYMKEIKKIVTYKELPMRSIYELKSLY
jgi:hypothetical protein